METLITSFEELAREEGRQEGQFQERRSMVLCLLTHKLGVIDDTLHVRIAALDPDTLLLLSDALFDFVTRADLTAWLAALPDPRAA